MDSTIFSAQSEELVLLSLGSNLGDRVANLCAAISQIATFASVCAVSSAYESEPVEYTAQPWFVNAAIALRATDSAGGAPHVLLQRLQQVELGLGRDRHATVPKGPRTIDLDIILYGQRVLSDERLTLPHPAMQQRRFVLQPLAEIAAEAPHPLLHQTIAQLLRALPAGGAAVHCRGALPVGPAAQISKGRLAL